MFCERGVKNISNEEKRLAAQRCGLYCFFAKPKGSDLREGTGFSAATAPLHGHKGFEQKIASMVESRPQLKGPGAGGGGLPGMNKKFNM